MTYCLALSIQLEQLPVCQTLQFVAKLQTRQPGQFLKASFFADISNLWLFRKFYYEPYFTAPSVTLHERNMSAVVIEVQRPEEDPAIQLYSAKIKNGTPEQAC